MVPEYSSLSAKKEQEIIYRLQMREHKNDHFIDINSKINEHKIISEMTTGKHFYRLNEQHWLLMHDSAMTSKAAP